MNLDWIEFLFEFHSIALLPDILFAIRNVLMHRHARDMLFSQVLFYDKVLSDSLLQYLFLLKEALGAQILHELFLGELHGYLVLLSSPLLLQLPLLFLLNQVLLGHILESALLLGFRLGLHNQLVVFFDAFMLEVLEFELDVKSIQFIDQSQIFFNILVLLIEFVSQIVSFIWVLQFVRDVPLIVQLIEYLPAILVDFHVCFFLECQLLFVYHSLLHLEAFILILGNRFLMKLCHWPVLPPV